MKIFSFHNRLAPRKRRTLAALAGLALGFGFVAARQLLHVREAGEFAASYASAHNEGNFEKLVGLFHWEGVSDAERGRMKLVLRAELELKLDSASLRELSPGEGAPRETLEGRKTPNLKPEFGLTLRFASQSGAGFTTWLVGRTEDGLRVSLYRPEPGNRQ